jgi:hypothetical protein
MYAGENYIKDVLAQNSLPQPNMASSR